MAGCLVIIIWPLWGLMNATTSRSESYFIIRWPNNEIAICEPFSVFIVWTHKSSVMGPVFMFKGLFVQCAQYMGGQYQCDNYLSPVFDQTWNLILGMFDYLIFRQF